MDELKKLIDKEINSPIEECIIWAVKTDATKEEAAAELAALREAGEKMAECLRNNKRIVDIGNPNNNWAFIDEDAAALAEWEAANK